MNNDKKNMDEIEILFDGYDENNITSVLNKWKEISVIRKKLDDFEKMLKDKVKVYLKERKWDKYKDDETDISVSISPQRRENVDKKMLQLMISESQYAQVVTTTTFERMTIMTSEGRARMKQFVK